MEEPDAGGTPVIFSAMGEVAGKKKEAKTSIGDRVKRRKSTPRPIMKGEGKKRYSLSPSPNQNLVSKRAFFSKSHGEEGAEEVHKRNLLSALNEVAGEKGTGALLLAIPEEEELCKSHQVGNEGGVLVRKSPDAKSKEAGEMTALVEERNGKQKTHSPMPEKSSPSPEKLEVTVGGVVQAMKQDRLGGQNSQAMVLAGSEFQNRKEGERSSESEVAVKSNPIFGWSTLNNPIVSSLDYDIQLDLANSQPLIYSPPLPLKSQQNFGDEVDSTLGGNLECFLELEKQFPQLGQGATKSLAAKFEGMAKGNNVWNKQMGLAGASSSPNVPSEAEKVGTKQKEGEEGSIHKRINHQVHQNPAFTSAASKVKNGGAPSKPNEPFVLQPEKISKIGCVGLREGRPSLYFSGEDTNYLAEKMGHAIVGKFSHSIPSSNQVQKMLENIRFTRGFTWNYINAKHIIIKLEDIEDYARMLNGPKGSPVWFIDHHPMRVFKWTPSFDSFFETPIATVWCNVIAVPIHLFEISALYAIGSLLGNPIQLDHDTANKKRLSFARICVEIDISKPPTEEVVLDILGKEMVLKVKWDKIPLYCRECKHVGHSSRNCHAFGNKEAQLVRFPHPAQYRQQGEYRARQPRYTEAEENLHGEASIKFGSGENGLRNLPKQGKGKESAQHHEVEEGTSSRPKSTNFADFVGEEGFIKQGRKGRKGKRGNVNPTVITRSSSADKVTLKEKNNVQKGDAGRPYSAMMGDLKQGYSNKAKPRGTGEGVLQQFAKHNPFQSLQHEEYMVEDNDQEFRREEETGIGENDPLQLKPPDRGIVSATMEVETEAYLLTEGPSALKLV